MKKIVTIGGGTGSYTALLGLKTLEDVSLSALVSMADNGGSTGRLRDELGVLPPGDVRQCLVALSEQTGVVRELINYRFTEGGLTGHSFGNILLAALEKVTGDFATGVEVASEILKTKGSVVPVTKDQAELMATLGDGSIAKGVVDVDAADFIIKGLEKIYYEKEVALSDNAKKAIADADYIVVGPGNYYCSVVPNLIVAGFKEALAASKAKIIFPVNLTNKHEHTKNWKVGDFVQNTEMYLGKPIDIILINSESPSDEQIERYKLQEGDGVLIVDDMGNDPRAIRVPLISHTIPIFNKADAKQSIRSFIRHDSMKLAQAVDNIIKQ